MGTMSTEAEIDFDADEAGLPPIPEGMEFRPGTEADVEAFNAAAQDDTEIPLVDDPQSDVVHLPGGLVRDGQVFREAYVRELTGEDEEHLARAQAGKGNRYLQMLLERGVVKIGPHDATAKTLDSMLIGDRDALVLGVRRATYGDDVEMTVVCLSCEVESKIRVSLAEDIPVKPLAWDALTTEHEVPLRRGVAVIRLANGGDQRHVFSMENKTIAELNSELLMRCVVSINGAQVHTLAQVRDLGAADRKTLIEWLADNQPGPDYDDVKHTCAVCGKETPLNLSAADLFPGA